MADVIKTATRDAYGKALVELGEKNPDVLVLDADLAAATKTGAFKKAFPERFFDTGIAEGNMMGVAAGLATTGYTVFASTFAMFGVNAENTASTNAEKITIGENEYEGVISFSAPGIRHRKPPRIGYVPQSPNFDPGECISVADLFACCMAKRPAFLGLGKPMRQKVRECLERVHAVDLIDKRVGTLSGGELQRILLALALEPLPNILILDEPLSGVDVEGMVSLMAMLDKIRHKYDLSILMTTHDFSSMQQYADQAVLIDGTVLDHGTPSDVLSGAEFDRVFHRTGGSL